MIFSRDRILTTHVGSLPRNDKLSDLLVRQEAPVRARYGPHTVFPWNSQQEGQLGTIVLFS